VIEKHYLWEASQHAAPMTPAWQACRLRLLIDSRGNGESRMELAPMSFLGWLVIGALAGWLAGRIVEGYGFGLVGNIVIGIIGACIGGLILPRLGIVPTTTGANFLAATLGAVILLVLLGIVQRR
jgi:uncharacterized membrane protein YeaQ/YmgE (transglycosylase-associated protein family)